MTETSAGQPAPAAAGPPIVATQPPAEPLARAGAACGPTADQRILCPACGDQMHLWANYQRCRNCGYKESCCF